MDVVCPVILSAFLPLSSSSLLLFLSFFSSLLEFIFYGADFVSCHEIKMVDSFFFSFDSFLKIYFYFICTVVSWLLSLLSCAISEVVLHVVKFTKL